MLNMKKKHCVHKACVNIGNIGKSCWDSLVDLERASNSFSILNISPLMQVFRVRFIFIWMRDSFVRVRSSTTYRLVHLFIFFSSYRGFHFLLLLLDGSSKALLLNICICMCLYNVCKFVCVYVCMCTICEQMFIEGFDFLLFQ